MKNRRKAVRSRSVPRKALLLAAGFGSRMKTLALDLPKPLMPLWGRPCIDRMLDLLQEFGVREVVVNVHHNPTDLIAFLQTRSRSGLQVNVSFEPHILGTGGALRRAAWFFGDEPFWVVNTDIAAALDAGPLIESFQRNDALAAVWLDPQRGPCTVEVEDGVVTSFTGGSPGTPDTGTFCGVQLVSPRIYQYLAREPFSTIIDAYQRGMRAGEKVCGVTCPDGFWADLGRRERYLDGHAEFSDYVCSHGRKVDDAVRGERSLRASGVTTEGNVAIAKDAIVGRGVCVRNSVVWSGARVHPGARLEDAIIGRDTDVWGTARGIVTRAELLPHWSTVQSLLSVADLPDAGWSAQLLPARGSDRSFVRLARGDKSCIVCDYGRERRENARYAAQGRFLRAHGVPVPQVLASSTSARCLLLEDAGDVSLEDLVKTATTRTVGRLYTHVVRATQMMHAIAPEDVRRERIALEPPFGRSLYHWEHDLFCDHFLKGTCGYIDAEARPLIRELRRLSERLIGDARVLLHRDLQSSNVLIRRGKPMLIDFQGMRWGPPAYDLASLLCDPYVMLPERTQMRLLEEYVAASTAGDVVMKTFWVAAVQRLVQALGAFGRLAAQPATARFSRYIPAGLTMLARAVEHVDGVPALRNWVERQRAIYSEGAEG